MPENAHEISLEAVIDRFQYDIGQYGSAETFALPEVAGRINHNMKYVQINDSLDQGMYLDEGLYRRDMQYGFFVQAGNRLTREDSHNKVFFGNMLLLPEGSDDEIHEQVAVKSRVSSETHKLLGEMALFQHLESLDIRTYRPAALLVGQKATHLMTYFEGNVATMDTVDWENMEIEEAWVEVDKVIDTMMQLYTNALFHGDLAFRNVAFDQTGKTVIIDPELMISAKESYDELLDAGVLFTPKQQRIYDGIVQKMSGEMGSVFHSIDRHILPLFPKQERPRSDEARLKIYKKHLFEPFKSRVRDLEDPIRSFLLRLTDDVVARKKAHAKEQKL